MPNSLTRNPVSSRWLGPIIDKELRVASRRRPTYAVRSGYILVLAVLVAMQWMMWMKSAASAGPLVAFRMGSLAGSVVIAIVWCQLTMAQVLAVVLLAGAIRDEIRRGSLEVLIASGVSSLEIVLGKVLSRLLPVVMALATSLPLLALVRLWGGVPGDYLIAGFCVTLTAVLAMASLSLFLSLSGAPAHKVTLTGAITLVVLYELGYLLWAGGGLFGSVLPSGLDERLCLLSPFSVMVAQASALNGGRGGAVSWHTHCALMLAFSGIILAVSTCLVRRAITVPHPACQGVFTGLASILRPSRCRRRSRRRVDPDGLRRVTSPTVLWKDCRGNVKRSLFRQIGWALLVGTPLIVLRLLARGNGVIEGLCGLFIEGWWLVMCIYTATLAALSISQEREASSWSVLLATPLTNIQIVRDKTASIVLKTLFGWLVFLLYSVANQVAANSMMGRTAFVSLLIMTVLNAPVYVTFLIGVGLYVGLRSRSTLAAVLVTWAAVFGFHFVRQEALIPFMAILFPLRLGAWLAYHAMNVTVEALVGIALLACTVRALRRHVF